MHENIGAPEAAVVLFLCVGFVMYFFPTIVAVGRKKTNTSAIFLMNLLLGWSVIGWIIALVWAVSKQMVDAPAANGAASLCPHCGKYNLPAAKFCSSCGAAAT